ncbi:hypothetical protein BC938DRAFT_477259 [Jimgerdemannia flammicorona]|uniref:Uncharacterized protein n=1 Tax=Jimgerdemannia flammicorona TaxID=994334 RepID=A0A433PB00_9FUNG|nr:hypothetical protein BC938DRAFT_477259 [Jimgerdemannia flammicorona]
MLLARSLQILRLNNNGLGVGGGTMIAKVLLANAEKAHADNRVSSLRTIICGRNRLEDGSSEALANAFAAHGTLVEVCMPQNGIRSDGIRHLTRGLFKNPNLRVLDLQDNTFTVLGCPHPRQEPRPRGQPRPRGRESVLQRDRVRHHRAPRQSHRRQPFQPRHAPAEREPSTCRPQRIMSVVAALEQYGHQDALDELDDMEDESEEEEEEEEGKKEKGDRVVESADMEVNSEPVRKANKEEEKEERNCGRSCLIHTFKEGEGNNVA